MQFSINRERLKEHILLMQKEVRQVKKLQDCMYQAMSHAADDRRQLRTLYDRLTRLERGIQRAVRVMEDLEENIRISDQELGSRLERLIADAHAVFQ